MADLTQAWTAARFIAVHTRTMVCSHDVMHSRVFYQHALSDMADCDPEQLKVAIQVLDKHHGL
jgi:hypothetical protein